MTDIDENEKTPLYSEIGCDLKDREGEAQNLLDDRRAAESNLPSSLSRVFQVFGYAFLCAFLISNIAHNVQPVRETAVSCDDPNTGYRCRPEISQYWGQYSPYFSIESEIPDKVPEGCEITFAQILSRHGARDPTLKRTLKYSSTVVKIQATAKNLTGPYAFLKKYRFNLGADQLNAFGRKQLYNSGVKFYRRYHHLTKNDHPFMRTSGQQRVIDSADAFMKGYHDAKKADFTSGKDKHYPYDMVIIREGPEFNNTLCHSLCDNLEDGALSKVRPDAKDAWVSVYGRPILYRLQHDLPDVPLVLDDMHNLMSMCPFDTVHSRDGTLSPFCDLFTEDEWHQYNHLESLDKFYGWGKGNPLGPSNGIGFTNELIARMTHSSVIDHTSVNHTLDKNTSTFPIGKQNRLFADFSHDNDLTAIFFAAGLYNSTPMLSITQVDPIDFTQGWSSAWTVPFGARAYFEKMICHAPKPSFSSSSSSHSHKNKTDGKEYVRVIVNDRVIPLSSCNADKLGRCTLSEFVESLSFARSGGNWGQCFLSSPDNRPGGDRGRGRSAALVQQLLDDDEVAEVAKMSLTGEFKFEDEERLS